VAHQVPDEAEQLSSGSRSGSADAHLSRLGVVMGVAAPSREGAASASVLRRWIVPGAALVLIAALPSTGRLVGTLAVITITFVVLALVQRAERSEVHSWSRSVVAMMVGILPTLMLFGLVHDLPSIELPVALSRVLLFTIWLGTSRTLGASVVRRVHGTPALMDVVARLGAVLAVTGFMTGALIRHLGSSGGPAARLAWILNEEDNAHIVGVAREVLTNGPRGAQLADQFGTSFVNLPLAVLRVLGGPLETDGDVRLQAITLFLLSTVLVIIVAGVSMALISALPHHVHRRSQQQPLTSGIGPAVLGASVSALAASGAFALLVVLPMRTGFLTFVWGLALVLSAAALVIVTPSQAGLRARIVVVLHLLATLWMLLSAWPFIVPALAPMLLLPLTWIPRGALGRLLTERRTATVVGGSLSLILAVSTVYWFLRWGPLAEVLSYGRVILVAVASGISADQRVSRIAPVLLLVAVALAWARTERDAGRVVVLALLGPVAGATLLFVGLRVAAELLTDGELNYSGVKLLYGIVTLTAVLGLPALASWSTSLRTYGPAIAGLVTALLIATSPTMQLIGDWWDRTDPQWAPNATATVEAIRGSSTDLPIRCLPPAGTAVTGRTRFAAYFCVRWMEDAFNSDRFHGHRATFLETDAETFEEAVEYALATNPSEYLFAYPFTMGPGWFGWNGTD
jgi:hypothetical protein